MTSFLTGGLGSLNSSPRSREAAALESGITAGKSFVNKDFVKNMAFLNQTVDTHSAYLQKLQAGVDAANENVLEQIQGFWGDLFVLFAGFEPTGIEIGDVKYIIQGIGAFFGINPETPFPLNLFEAALHFFNTYIIPLDQFTDVIFDAILAWAEELGLSEEFITAIEDLMEAIGQLGESFMDLFDSLGELLGAFGFLDWTSTSGLGDLWDALVNLIDGLALEPLKPVLSLLADLGIPFINALTAIINTANAFLDPLGSISGSQIAELGQNIAPAPQDNTTVWGIGGDSVNAWVYDPTLTASSISTGSLTTMGTGSAKRVVSQKTFSTTAGQKFTVKAKLRWASIPSASNEFGVAIVWYQGLVEQSSTYISISGGHGTTGGWTEVSQADVQVPINIDGFKIAARVGNSITAGQVWVDDISVQLQGKVSMSFVDGLVEALSSVPVLGTILGWFGLDPGGDENTLQNFLGGLLGGDSPLNALNLFNIGNLFGKLPIGQLSNDSPNLLDNNDFREAISIQGGGIWTWDETVGKTVAGSAKVEAAGVVRQLMSNAIAVSEDDEIESGIYVQWENLVYTGSNPIKFQIVRLLYDSVTQQFATMGIDDIATVASPAANQLTWLELSDDYVVPSDCSHVALQLEIGSNATGGFIWFDDGTLKKNGLIKQSWVSGLVGALQNVFDLAQGVVNSIWEGLFGNSPIGDVLFSDIINGLQNINPLNVLGLQGGTIVDTFQGTIDTLFGGFARLFGGVTGKSIFDVASQAAETVTTAETGLLVGEWNNAILAIRNNKPLMQGMDSTEESNFLMDTMFDGASNPPSISATASNVPIAFWLASEDSIKGFISWFGKGITNVTGIYIDLYQMDYDTSTLDHFHTSENLVSLASGSWGTLIYFLPEVARFQVIAGKVIGVAWRVTGTGTHEIAGKKAPWLPNHPGVHPQKPAASRTGVGDLAFGSINYSGDIPWFGIGIVEGDTPENYHAPRTTQISTAGAFTYNVPDWADEVDEILISGGGGGQGGDFVIFQTGQGGRHGNWSGKTLIRGVDFPDTTGVTLSGTIGNGGDYGGWPSQDGENGDATVRNAISGGAVSHSAAGGLSGRDFGSGKDGQSPGNYTFNGITYPGGGSASNGKPGANGQSPGGGGGGGDGGTWGVAWRGGNGARGGAWYVARQVD